jgi:ribonuclease BN (tRNA processing enzyme)
LHLIGGEGSSRWIREVLELGYEGAYEASKCFALEFTEIAPASPRCFDGVELRTAVSDHPVSNHALRIEADGKALCYSGDGSPTDATRALFEAAAVLVHECYRPGPGVPGHANALELLELARTARVDRLCLLHLERGALNRQAVTAAIEARLASGEVLLPAPGDVIGIRS